MIFEIRNILLNIVLIVFIHIFVSHIYSEHCSRYYRFSDIFGLNVIRTECKMLLKIINITSNIIENLNILIITTIITIVKMYKYPKNKNIKDELLDNFIKK